MTEDIDAYIRSYETLAKDILDEPVDKSYRARFDDLKRFMHDTKNDAVLDIGSSQGLFLQEIGFRYAVAFDISKEFLKATPEEFNPIRGNAEMLPFKDNMFSTVIASDIIEHVFHPELVIREVRRVLTPGGKFYMVLPWKEDISKYDQFKGKYDYCHLRSFDSIKDVEVMLWNSGWKIPFKIKKHRGSVPKLPGILRVYDISPTLYRTISKMCPPFYHMMFEVV